MDFEDLLDCGKLVAMMLFLAALLGSLNCGGGVGMTGDQVPCWIPSSYYTGTGTTDAGETYDCVQDVTNVIWDAGDEGAWVHSICCIRYRSTG